MTFISDMLQFERERERERENTSYLSRQYIKQKEGWSYNKTTNKLKTIINYGLTNTLSLYTNRGESGFGWSIQFLWKYS